MAEDLKYMIRAGFPVGPLMYGLAIVLAIVAAVAAVDPSTLPRSPAFGLAAVAAVTLAMPAQQSSRRLLARIYLAPGSGLAFLAGGLVGFLAALALVALF